MTAQTKPYDLFKSVVAVILVIIFILLLLRSPQPPVQAALPTTTQLQMASATVAAATSTPLPPATLAATATATAKNLPPFPNASFEWFFNAADSTLVDPQGKGLYRLDAEANIWLPVIPVELEAVLPLGYRLSQAESGWIILGENGDSLYRWEADSFSWVKLEPVVEATATQALGGTPTPTETPKPAAPGATPTPTIAPTATAPASIVVCAGALPSRLTVGDSVRVTTSLNLRSEPGIGNNLIGASATNTRLQIVGGPVCLPYEGSAYVWWQVQGPDGQTGWSAEASATGSFYFLEPVP